MRQNVIISFIGAGNVASHLALNLFASGVEIKEIWSRSDYSAFELSKEVKAKALKNLEDLDTQIDILILSVPDDHIEEVAQKLPRNINIVHTSGSVSLDVLSHLNFKNSGIFYPLQTFTKERELDLDRVPFLLESDSREFMKQLETLAGEISSDVRHADSDERKTIHLAAVFASNFTNDLLGISNEILQEKDINLYILKSLIFETIQKALQSNPYAVQTGPAKRGDQKILENQINQLKSDHQKNIYQAISDHIASLKN